MLLPPLDFMNKVRKGLDSGGPSFTEVLTPCPKGWFFDPKDTVDFAKLALETRIWVSWEYANGEFSLTYKPRKFTPVKEYLRLQGRFAHLILNTEASLPTARLRFFQVQRRRCFPFNSLSPSTTMRRPSGI
jgi:pyruvate/2-oxoacid:ferredoxin oxidoreductase beta subunit